MDNPKDKLILLTNPGSSSRKYSLYRNSDLIAALHFEFENDKIICTLTDESGVKKPLKVDFSALSEAVNHIKSILEAEGYITGVHQLDAIVARLVAPSEYFAKNHIVDEDFMVELEKIKEKAPLHTPVIAEEIVRLRKAFNSTPIISVSDSEFHSHKPDLMKYYAFDTDLADKYEIKRYGYHGLSVGSIVETMKASEILPEKLIVAHIGSGSSVSAVLNGKAMDTTMGYSPLEGVMMATRAGSMDVAAAMALKKALKLESDEALEKYLNKQTGLVGVSGETDDMRMIIQKRDEGEVKATFAHALYIYKLHNAIGQMAAALDGADAIVMTATIGERNAEIRNFVVQKLGYLGFRIDKDLNEKVGEVFDTGAKFANIAGEGSKPIYVIKTDESAEMVRQALALI
jgi:acetate kinase